MCTAITPKRSSFSSRAVTINTTLGSAPINATSSNVPTGFPTAAAIIPTGEPTSAPSGEPTHKPTSNTVPTGVPTYAPTAPTGVPTFGPTAPTGSPTYVPTAPTGSPTFAPTAPTGQPTYYPTGEPTSRALPTENPALAPTLPTANFLIGNTMSLPPSAFTPSVQSVYLNSLATTLKVPVSSTRIVNIKPVGSSLLQNLGSTEVDSAVTYLLTGPPPTTTSIIATLTAPNASFADTFKNALVNSTSNSTLRAVYTSLLVSAPVVTVLSSAPSSSPTGNSDTISSSSVSNGHLSRPSIIAVAVLVPVGFCLLLAAGYATYYFCNKRQKESYVEQRISPPVVARGPSHEV